MCVSVCVCVWVCVCMCDCLCLCVGASALQAQSPSNSVDDKQTLTLYTVHLIPTESCQLGLSCIGIYTGTTPHTVTTVQLQIVDHTYDSTRPALATPWPRQPSLPWPGFGHTFVRSASWPTRTPTFVRSFSSPRHYFVMTLYI